jgi:anti-sigma factor RsiW
MSRSNHNTNCTWVHGVIESYLDGELTQHERAMFEDHLGQCARCRQELSAAESVLGELHVLPMLKCPDRVTDQVFEHVDSLAQEPKAGRSGTPGGLLGRWLGGRYFGLPRPAVTGALVVVIIVSSIFVGRLSRPTEQITPAQIAEAEAAVKWTFAYVNQVGRRSGFAVRDEVFGTGVMQPVRRVVRSALVTNDTEQHVPQEDGSI